MIVAGRKRLGRFTGVLAAASVVVAGFVGGVFAAPSAVADSKPAAGVEETVTADALPTTQIDGVAWDQEIVGNTVYVGGEFTTARPAGSAAGVNTTGRSNLLSYNLSTGDLLPWNPGANAQIKAIAASPDGSRVYVAGSFTEISGQTRYRIAAFDTATGALLSWAPGVNARVDDIIVTSTAVYMVGIFTNVGGQARAKVAAVSASTGAVLPMTADVQGGYGARAIVASPDGTKIVIGGSFTSVNGSTNPGRGLAALDAATGASMPWAINSVIRNGGTNASIYSLASDGDSVYGTGYDYGGGSEDGFEGTFRANWTDGSMVWLEDCHGDNYSVAAVGDVVYTASHDHYCGNVGGFPQTNPWTFHHSSAWAKDYHGAVLTPDIYGYKSYSGQPAATQLTWYPSWGVGTYTGQNQATWDVTGNSDYVVYGGEFNYVNNKSQQGLVRFAKTSKATNTRGPQLGNATWPLSAISYKAGENRLGWSANWDQDNEELTYQVQRQDLGTAYLTTVTKSSSFWKMPAMTYTDTTATPGATYNYRIRVSDALGNVRVTDWTSITTATTDTSTTYDDTVIDSAPQSYWPLNEASGTAGYDWASGNDLTVNSATRGAAAQITNGKATSFSGSSSSFATTTTAAAGPDVFTIEAWFKTTSTSGGKIVGFGNSSTGNSGSYDRHVYINNSGAVTFGVYPGTTRTITSGTGYNNGQWHHVVASMSSAGMSFYLDDVLVGTRTDTTNGQSYNGYWRVGGDTVSSWPNGGSSSYLNGSIASVAIYDRALTRSEVDEHWVASGRVSTIPAAPADTYGASVYNLDPTLYWRLGESSGTTVNDSGRNEVKGTYYGSNRVTKGVSGALSGVSNTAVSLAPTKNGGTWQQTGAVSNRSFINPTTFALETWFKTSTTTGGKLIGFGDVASGLSSNYDRHVYMSADGRVKFGVYNGSSVIIQSAAGLNDNKWHHVVAQMSASGMQLYVDGELVGTDPNTTAQNFTGYWRVGGDSTWEGDPYWKGSLDEVAVYSAPLTSTDVLAHYSLGTTGVVNTPPVAAFSSIVTDLDVVFDASTSSDAEGAIASYSWDFGDGQTGTGVSPTHAYATAGAHDVKLTVTDAKGAKSSVTNQVTTKLPNVAPTAAFIAQVSNLTASLDASSSADADGTIVSYSWAFGDGATGTGVTASHLYAAAGTFSVTLTVTDSDGASSTTTQDVTVVAPPNEAPTAAFTTTVEHLSVSVDGSGSSDSDGSVASYAWDFGDGGSGSGATASHAYAAAGTYTVKLTVTDDDGATAEVTHDVTVAAAPANVAPSAAFTSQVSGLSVSVDGSGSSDSDGSVASYAWDFGDSGSGSGATASHAYAAAGTYTVKLTVTDDDGATAEVTHDVTVTAPPVTNVIASDAFERSVTGGWGTADAGGAWTVTGGASRFTVSGGAGNLVAPVSQTLTASLNDVSSSSVRVDAEFSIDKLAEANYVALVGRKVGADQYLLRLRVSENGTAQLYVIRNSTQVGATYTVPGLTLTAGETYRMVFQVTGTGTTSLKGKFWVASQAEPAAWQMERTDTTAALQAAGSVGMFTLLPAAQSAKAPVTVAVKNYTVTDPSL